MSLSEQIKSALQIHFEAWNAGDRERWVSLFAEDVILEDPVGGPEKRGLESVEETWDHAFNDRQHWDIEPVVQWVLGNEAALHVRNRGTIDGKQVVVDSIEILTYNDDGKVAHLRSYFEPPEGVDYPSYWVSSLIDE